MAKATHSINELKHPKGKGIIERASDNILLSLDKLLPTSEDYRNPNRLISASMNVAMNAPMMATFIGPKSALWDKKLAAKATKMLDKGTEPALVWEKTRIGKLPSGGLFSEISDELLKINPLARNAKTGQAYTEGLGAGSIIEHPELAKAYPQTNKLGTIIMGGRNALGSYSPGAHMIKLSPEVLGAPKSIRETAAHELQHVISDIEGWPSGGSPSSMKMDDFADFFRSRLKNNRTMEQAATKSGDTKRADLAKKVYADMYQAAQQDAYEKLAGEALSNETSNRLFMKASDRQQWYPMFTGKLGGIKVSDLINKYDSSKANSSPQDSLTIIQKLLKEQAKSDLPTAIHQARVGAIINKLSRESGITGDDAIRLRASALGHDLGKTRIPKSILNKNTPLTDLEFNVIRTHPDHTADILKKYEIDPDIIEMARSHHMQQIPGKGYPAHDGMPKAGSERLQAADIFDSLIGGEKSGHSYPLRFRKAEIPRTASNILMIMDSNAATNEIDPAMNNLIRKLYETKKLPKKLIKILENQQK